MARFEDIWRQSHHEDNQKTRLDKIKSKIKTILICTYSISLALYCSYLSFLDWSKLNLLQNILAGFGVAINVCLFLASPGILLVIVIFIVDWFDTRYYLKSKDK